MAAKGHEMHIIETISTRVPVCIDRFCLSQQGGKVFVAPMNVVGEDTEYFWMCLFRHQLYGIFVIIDITDVAEKFVFYIVSATDMDGTTILAGDKTDGCQISLILLKTCKDKCLKQILTDSREIFFVLPVSVIVGIAFTRKS